MCPKIYTHARRHLFQVVTSAALTLIAGCHASGHDGGMTDMGPAQAVPVTVLKMGNGSVTSSPAAINCGDQCSAQIPLGAPINLIATPGPGHMFAGWGGACTGMEPVCTLTVDQALSVTAGFSPIPENRVLLSVSRSGQGTVTSTPAGISCGTECAHMFSRGSVINLSAQPAPGERFLGWSGACSSTTGACTVVLEQARNVSAQFGPIPRYQLSVAKAGSGDGVVSSAPGGISCGSTCSAEFLDGSAVNLTAAPYPNMVFSGWGGACSGSSPACTVNLKSSATATAHFSLQTCPRRTITFKPRNVDYMPPLTRGDRDFGGWGPAVYSTVNLLPEPKQLQARVFMRAIETGTPDTAAEGSADYTLYTPDPGWVIVGVAGSLFHDGYYVDTDHDVDSFWGSHPVKRWDFRGDNKGDDVGYYTGVNVEFEALTIELMQDHDCAP